MSTEEYFWDNTDLNLTLYTKSKVCGYSHKSFLEQRVKGIKNIIVCTKIVGDFFLTVA